MFSSAWEGRRPPIVTFHMVSHALVGHVVSDKILDLRTETEQKVLSIGKRAANAKAALDFLYRQPFVDAIELEKALGISRATAHILINKFAGLGILMEATGQQRGRIFCFENYLRLFTD